VEGDSEVMLVNIFERARTNAPSILIFDDLNSVASSRKGEIGSEWLIIIIVNILTCWKSHWETNRHAANRRIG